MLRRTNRFGVWPLVLRWLGLGAFFHPGFFLAVEGKSGNRADNVFAAPAFTEWVGSRGKIGCAIHTEPVASQLLDEGDEVFKRSWLDQVGICTQVVGSIDIVGLRRGSEHHNEQAFQTGLLPNPRQNFKAGFEGHFKVEQQEKWERAFLAVAVGFLALEIIDRLGAIRDRLEDARNSCLVEGTTHQEQVVLVIIGQQDDRLIGHDFADRHGPNKQQSS
jgi:hypothetical protein